MRIVAAAAAGTTAVTFVHGMDVVVFAAVHDVDVVFVVVVVINEL